ncbi:hypothetical protein Goshw_002621 [Gossypium schwendimanii]|uniref:MULE transposase domain-containing protein n=1 Tax=Gossypium schwendimanii TaxID=34291 RepID=A0A7J9NA41_GOSSC|nr:hypothetical protein [Gossypium schwendimanii]
MAKCRRAKKMVKDKLVGNFVQKFAMLWDYVYELRLKNPRSTIKMALNRITSESPPDFKRFYVCFEALKRGPFKGELLAAVGRDGNYQMYLVAWVIVKGECIDSWTWFLSLLTADLRMKDGFGYTIISDQQKGLKIAINDILPRVEHRNCARHLDEGVVKELFSKNLKAWTKAFQGLHSVSDIIDNNLCEAFNSNILESRFNSIITMLEEIRVNMITKIVAKRKQFSS